MTNSPTSGDKTDDKPATAMRVIVPLQGVVQGRGGLVLGSLIPCVLFYCFQLYQRYRSRSPPPGNGEVPHGLSRVQSRSLLTPRGGPAHVGSRANCVSDQDETPFFVGLKRVFDDPFHRLINPDGVFQLGLPQNRVSFSRFCVYVCVCVFCLHYIVKI